MNAKDDLAIAQRRMQQQRSRRSASQAAVNRLSLGDFATTFATPAPKSLPPNSLNYDPVHGLSITASPENPNNHHRMHPYPPSAPLIIDHSASSPPGVDLDAVAAMIHNRDTSNSHQPGNAKPQGRTLAGVLSGAAANLRSKLSNLNTAQELSTPAAATAAPSAVLPPSVQHHQQHHQGHQGQHGHQQQHHQGQQGHQQHQQIPQQQRRISSTSNGGGGIINGMEQSPAAIPITVPGADVSKHAYNFPHRLEVRPIGPRDPPVHFQRKQEYL